MRESEKVPNFSVIRSLRYFDTVRIVDSQPEEIDLGGITLALAKERGLGSQAGVCHQGSISIQFLHAAARHRQYLPADPAGGRRTEEQRRIGHVLRLA